MNTYTLCPISDKRINEKVARGNAVLTVLFLALYLFTTNTFVIAFLLIDFLLRGLELSQYSPFAIISKKVTQLLAIKPKLINAGPKVFAARIGVFFSASILLAATLGFNTTALVLTGIFGICAFLEAAIGFCVACQIYPLLYKLYYESKLNVIK
jgi:hypothetical protein